MNTNITDENKNSELRNFPELLKGLAEQIPEKEAFCFSYSEQAFSYQLLDSYASSIAEKLSEKLQKGDRVLLLFPDQKEFIPAFFACMYSGTTAVPAAMPRKKNDLIMASVLRIIQDAEISAVLTTTSGLNLFYGLEQSSQLDFFTCEKTDPNLLTVEHESISLKPNYDWNRVNISSSDIAILQYTSGLVGNPKGVKITHGNIWENSKAIYEKFGHSSSSKGVIWLPHFHDMGLFGGILQPIFGHFPCRLLTPLEFIRRPYKWLKEISDFKATTSGGPNFSYDLCFNKIRDEQLETLDLSPWSVAFCGAEAINIEVMKKFSKKFSAAKFSKNSMTTCYGLAEATLMVTTTEKHQGLHYLSLDVDALKSNRVEVEYSPKPYASNTVDIASCGSPLKGHDIKIINPHSKVECGKGEIGEICFSGPSVASGYWKNREESNFGIKINNENKLFMLTGDLGFIHNNELYVTGRAKEMIVVNGKNHCPTDIENTLRRNIEEISDRLIIAFSTDAFGGERLVVLIEYSVNKVDFFEKENILQKIQKTIFDKHGLIVYELVVVKPKGIPRTTSGKLKRPACKQLYENNGLEPIWKYSFNNLSNIPAKVERNGSKNGSIFNELTEEKKLFSIDKNVDDKDVEYFSSMISEILGANLGRNVGSAEWDLEFHSLGVTSLIAEKSIGELENKLDTSLSVSMIYDFPTISKLSREIAFKQPLLTKPKTPKKIPKIDSTIEIAVVGIGCRLPGIDNPLDFWSLLNEGKMTTGTVPSQRWRKWTLDPDNAMGSFFDSIGEFDPSFFGISAQEANFIDPQHRLLLEVTQEAIDDAGIKKSDIFGSQTGVFVGISTNDYSLISSDTIGAYSALGNSHSLAANRISYLYDLKGPSIAVDSACSSSLVATIQAVQSIRSGDCQLAIAGGVNLILTPHLQKAFAQAGMLSKDGKCHIFDKKASGYARGEGCGVVILKPLAAALRDGDRVYAKLVGAAVNQDGRSNGITAPNGNSQIDVISKALENTHIKTSDIGYVETHGTGTKLGDLIEFEALEKAFSGVHRGPLKVGSVKTNVGHLEAGAGIIGLIKVSLMLYFRRLVPHLNFTTYSEQIKKIKNVVEVQRKSVAWPDNTPFIAGVSSFGFGGTNAHLIMSTHEPLDNVSEEPLKQSNIILVSAHSLQSLRQQITLVRKKLTELPKEQLSEFCRSYNCHRDHDRFRYFLAGDSQSLLSKAATSIESTPIDKSNTRKLALIFPGQGSHQLGMGRTFYKELPIFRKYFDRCAAVTKSISSVDLHSVIEGRHVNELTHSPLELQLLVFSTSYAIAKSLQQLGITPHVVLGYSFGEYAAATVSGAMSLENAVKVLCTRNILLNELADKGKMAIVLSPISKLTTLLLENFPDIAIVAHNSETAYTIAGDREKIYDCLIFLREKGIIAHDIEVPYAYHSEYMEALIPAFSDFLSTAVRFSSGTIPILSSCDLSYQTTLSEDYWAQQIRKPILFRQAIFQLLGDGVTGFVDLSADKSLSRFIVECIDNNAKVFSIGAAEGEMNNFLQLLGSLWVLGDDIGCSMLYEKRGRGHLRMPKRSYIKNIHWVKDEVDNPDIINSLEEVEKKEHNKREKELHRIIKEIVASSINIPIEEVNTKSPLLEVGVSSLALLEIMSKIKNRLGMSIQIKGLFENLNTVDSLASYISSQEGNSSIANNDQLIEVDQSIELIEALDQMSLEDFAVNQRILSLIEKQTDLMQKHIKLLKKIPSKITDMETLLSLNIEKEEGIKEQASNTQVDENNRCLKQACKNSFPEKQQRHLDRLKKGLNHKTSSSKGFIQEHYEYLADNRALAGFCLSTKELLYPIVVQKALGSKIWDIDGNEYIDFTMGFGTYLFGHNASFIKEALLSQLEGEMKTGNQAEKAGEVAKKICKLTGVDRVAYCNSDSEAVMTAIRLARAKTKKNKLVIFSGAYHGIFDGVLGRKSNNREKSIVPISQGVPESFLQDLVVLDYGSENALEWIREYSESIAAVLVEPIQNLCFDFQPREFLLSLREMANDTGFALIFDEVTTGFRLAGGGAQSYFNVQADIVIYGKIVGGGFPIGIVAGSKQYMDFIDAGDWKHDNTFYPSSELVFFADTLSKHSLVMVASSVILEHIAGASDSLYKDLAKKTQYLSSVINHFFLANRIPMEVVFTESLFRFKHSKKYDDFYYNLLKRGIYIWEGKDCFLSSAHSAEDIDIFINAVINSVITLRGAGYFGGNYLSLDTPYIQTDSQYRFTSLIKVADKGDSRDCGNIGRHLIFNEKININALKVAWSILLSRHDVFSFVPAKDGTWCALENFLPAIDELYIEDKKILENSILQYVSEPFDYSQKPLIKIRHIVCKGGDDHLIIISHHSISDGWSYGILLKELFLLYSAELKGHACSLPPAPSYQSYLEYSKLSNIDALESYWRGMASCFPNIKKPLVADAGQNNFVGSKISTSLSLDTVDGIIEVAKKSKVTQFTILNSIWAYSLANEVDHDQLAIGVSMADRDFENGYNLVGQCVRLIPIFHQRDNLKSWDEMFTETHSQLKNMRMHSSIPIHYLRGGNTVIPIWSTFTMEPNGLDEDFPFKVNTLPVVAVEFPLMITIIEQEGGMSLELNFQKKYFSVEAAKSLLIKYKSEIASCVDSFIKKSLINCSK